MNTYTELNDTLRGRDTKKIGNNTWAVRLGEDRIGIRLHSTIVVVHYSNGQCTVHTGGYRTVTTKDRLNKHTPNGVAVFQRKGDWYVTGPIGGHDVEYPFTEGMEVSAI